MMRAAAVIFVLISMTFAAGCQTRRWVCGGGIAERIPLVSIESVTPAKDSPSHALPISPFPLPFHPFEMVRAGIEGAVDVRIVVGKDGRVKEAFVLKSSMREFEEPALLAVRHWRFLEIREPGEKELKEAIVVCRIKFGFDES